MSADIALNLFNFRQKLQRQIILKIGFVRNNDRHWNRDLGSVNSDGRGCCQDFLEMREQFRACDKTPSTSGRIKEIQVLRNLKRIGMLNRPQTRRVRNNEKIKIGIVFRKRQNILDKSLPKLIGILFPMEVLKYPE